MEMTTGKNYEFPDEETLLLRGRAITQCVKLASWIEKTYESALNKAILFQLFEGIDVPAFMQKIEQREILHVLFYLCRYEWLMINARLSIRGKSVRAVELAERSRAPKLDAFSRMALGILSRAQLSLYEVVEVEPDRGCWLRDLFEPAAAPVFGVTQAFASAFEKGDILALRLRRYEGWNDMGGALLPFEYEQAMELVQAMPDIVRQERLSKGEDVTDQDLVSLAILHSWMKAVAEARDIDSVPGGSAWQRHRSPNETESKADDAAGATQKGRPARKEREGRIGRNAPCPCGSGKKYKHCCLGKADKRGPAVQETADSGWQAASSPNRGRRLWARNLQISDECLQSLIGEIRPLDASPAVQKAMAWLMRYKEVREKMDVMEAIEEVENIAPPLPFPEEIERRLRDRPYARAVVDACLREWLLAESQSRYAERMIPVFELLCAPGAPKFTPQEWKELEMLAASRLTFFEIVEVRDREGLVLQDVAHPKAPTLFVSDPELARECLCWDFLAARVLDTTPPTLGRGVCRYPRRLGLAAERVREAMIRQTASPVGHMNGAWMVLSSWLLMVGTVPLQAPGIVDRKTGEFVLYTTDSYDVSDWQALERLLGQQHDVWQERANLWVRTEPLSAVEDRSIAWLERCPSGRLEVEGRTPGLADAARKWLTKLAGSLVRHVGRRHVPFDQKCTLVHDEMPELSKEETDMMYAGVSSEGLAWLDQPNPQLGGKSPRMAVRNKKLRPQVVEELKEFERGLQRKARAENWPRVTLGFIWTALGLQRK